MADLHTTVLSSRPNQWLMWPVVSFLAETHGPVKNGTNESSWPLRPNNKTRHDSQVALAGWPAAKQLASWQAKGPAAADGVAVIGGGSR